MFERKTDVREIDLIITGSKALLLDPENSCIDNAAVAIDAGVIVAAGQADKVIRQYRARKTLKTEDSLIMPGFVNCHTHAAMTCFRGIADDLELMDWLNN